MPTFKIDGVEYSTLEDDMTLDEAGWFYDIAGVGPEALAELGAGFQPKILKGLLCLSIKRAKPETPNKEIEERIGSLKLTELESVFEGLGEQSPPAPDSSEGTETSGPSSSDDSEDSPAAEDLPPTGAPSSETPKSDQDSDLETSAALRRVS